MGKTFELISDKALEKALEEKRELNNALGKKGLEECNICGEEAVLYSYQGEEHDEEGEYIDDCYMVCAECILKGSINHSCDFEYIKTIETYLDTLTLSIEEKKSIQEILINKYQRTPDIPLFMQREDRPLCCNDIAEFIGHPESDEELFEISEQNIYWEQGIKPKLEYCNFREYGIPESYRDIAAFKCSHCEQKYFTFQFT